ncbi:MAG: translation initiation factor IF-3 [bacterium]
MEVHNIIKPIRVNERIRIPEVRVVDENNNPLGIMRTYEALRMARERHLDLIETAPTANPPVCKIMEYGKYKYDLEKKESEAKKKQQVILVKEIQMRPLIDEHDYLFKMNHIKNFLGKGHRIKVVITFRGREIVHVEYGNNLTNRLIEDLKDISEIAKPPKMEGKSIIIFFAPISKKKKI